MKICQILALLLAFSVLNSSTNLSFTFKSSQNDKKLTDYVCKLARDITKSSDDNQDILIGNLGGKAWSSIENDIAECVGQNFIIVISDFKSILTEKTLRKAAIIILISESSAQSIKTLIQKHHFGSVWNFKAKIIYVTSYKVTISQRLNILSLFFNLGFINVAVIHVNQVNVIQVEFIETMTGIISIHTGQLNHSLVFPDKLKSMNGFQYKIVVYDQPPKVKIINRVIHSPLIYFLLAVGSQQKSRFNLNVIDDYHQLKDYWIDRKMDLTINTGAYFHNSEPKLQTYIESGYCGLVPLPPKTQIFQSIFIKPFDSLTWMLFAITIACSVAVWWMFRGRGAFDSPWLLAYGMFVMFVGQGVDFSRKNRLVLTILLQLIIVMIWILSNAYEGVITSFMIQPIHEHRLETFDDLIASDYNILTDALFVLRINGSAAYDSLKSRISTTESKPDEQFALEILRQHYVFIIKCDQAKLLIDQRISLNYEKFSDYYYLMPQIIVPNLDQLEASFLNPFLDRFQHYMDLSFQAGLMHIWKVFEPETSLNSKDTSTIDGPAYLKLEDLTQVFSVLIIGYLLSIVALLCEIFFHNVMREVKLAHFRHKLRNRVHQMAHKKRKQPKHPKYQKGALYYIIHRRKRVKRLKPKKLRVRRIYIQPRFPVD